MKESEWRTLRELLKVSLERFCERILKEIQEISEQSDKTFHERYLAVYRLIRERDEEVAGAFNDPRRSNALHKLIALWSLKLISTEELGRFEPGTQETVKSLVSPGNRGRL